MRCLPAPLLCCGWECCASLCLACVGGLSAVHHASLHRALIARAVKSPNLLIDANWKTKGWGPWGTA